MFARGNLAEESSNPRRILDQTRAAQPRQDYTRPAWSGLAWSALVCSGLVWSGLVWSGLVWSGLLWSGLVWSGLRRRRCSCHRGRRRGRKKLKTILCMVGPWK